MLPADFLNFHCQSNEDISVAWMNLWTNQHVCLNTCSFRIVDFSVNAECLLMYGFHGFFSNSIIFCLSSELTLGFDINFGKIPSLYLLLYIADNVFTSMALPMLLPIPEIRKLFAFPLRGCSSSQSFTYGIESNNEILLLQSCHLLTLT